MAGKKMTPGMAKIFGGAAPARKGAPVKKTMANFEKSGADVDVPGADENSPAEKAKDKKQFAAWKPGKAPAKKKGK